MSNVQWDKSTVFASGYLWPAIKQIMERLRLSKQAKVLDVGCGVGYYSKTLYDMGYTNVWSFDNYAPRVNEFKNILTTLADKCALHDALEQKLPAGFPSGEYDVVMMLEVIEHLIEPQQCMNNISSWLKKGGIAIVSAPYHSYLKNLSIALFNRFDWHYAPLESGRHINFFSRATLSRCMRASGLTPKHFYGVGRTHFLWKSMIITGEK